MSHVRFIRINICQIKHFPSNDLTVSLTELSECTSTWHLLSSSDLDYCSEVCNLSVVVLAVLKNVQSWLYDSIWSQPCRRGKEVPCLRFPACPHFGCIQQLIGVVTACIRRPCRTLIWEYTSQVHTTALVPKLPNSMQRFLLLDQNHTYWNVMAAKKN